MDESDSIISPAGTTEDLVADNALRPKRLKDYLGQASVHEQMEIFIEAARKRSEALDHVLIFGPPGLGKTTLAHIIATAHGHRFGRVGAEAGHCGTGGRFCFFSRGSPGERSAHRAETAGPPDEATESSAAAQRCADRARYGGQRGKSARVPRARLQVRRSGT